MAIDFEFHRRSLKDSQRLIDSTSPKKQNRIDRSEIPFFFSFLLFIFSFLFPTFCLRFIVSPLQTIFSFVCLFFPHFVGVRRERTRRHEVGVDPCVSQSYQFLGVSSLGWRCSFIIHSNAA